LPHALHSLHSQQAVQRSGAIQIGPQHVEARLPIRTARMRGSHFSTVVSITR